MEKVSVYIPAYNGAIYLDRVINSLLMQTVMPSEIIVIDDGSSDETPRILDKYPVKVIRNNENLGLAISRNIALKTTKSDYIASVDCDCVPARDWLENCLRCFDDSSVVGVGGKLIESQTNFAADFWRSKNLVQHFGDDFKEVEFLPGSNTVFSKKHLLKAGKYNEKYKSNFEDVDISQRLISLGGKLVYIPDAEVFHIKKDTVSSVLKTCWKYRHQYEIAGFSELLIDAARNFFKGVILIFNSMIFLHWKSLSVDILFFPIQMYFSIKSFMLKTTDV